MRKLIKKAFLKNNHRTSCFIFLLLLSLTLVSLTSASSLSLAASPMALVGARLANSHETWACKDCPFPMRENNGRFLLPNGEMYLILTKTRIAKGKLDIAITVHDAHTDDILAFGSIRIPNDRNEAHVIMSDRNGGTIQAHIFWTSPLRDSIRVKFTCSECEFERLAE
jgi:hypothetical protein